jgi:hypothetical protein
LGQKEKMMAVWTVKRARCMRAALKRERNADRFLGQKTASTPSFEMPPTDSGSRPSEGRSFSVEDVGFMMYRDKRRKESKRQKAKNQRRIITDSFLYCSCRLQHPREKRGAARPMID